MRLRAAAAVAAAIPSGMIAAFATTTCPSGWSEYTAARGAFLRGIDNGAGRDPNGTRAPGNYQADTLASHTHGINDPGHVHTINGNILAGNESTSALNNGVQGAGGYSKVGELHEYSGGANTSSVTTGISIQSTGGAETAPKNVAVTFCQKN